MGKTERLTNCTTGGPVFVYVEDGRIVRITPIDLSRDDAKSWSIEARGREFTPPRKTTVTPATASFKSMIYSDKRILYPMKRVDFDPNGERNCEKRGESGYVRISWDEALDIVCSEMIRIKREYGNSAILMEPSSHHLWGNVGYYHGVINRFNGLAGFSYGSHNPDSWEGWYWGAQHILGNPHRLGVVEQYDLLEDTLKNSEMIVFWSSDPETTSGIYGAFESTVRRFWMKELGIKMVFIDPYYNHTCGLFGGKWLAPRMGTDPALACAIAYVWLTEELYDKEYIKTKTKGFDLWAQYILGKEDGIPKTPEWAAKESGIPAHDIRALAREWGTKRTMLAAGGLGGWGGACRSANGGEWARLMVCLAAMQGMGKPGSNIYSTTQGTPVNTEFMFPGYAEGGISGDTDNTGAGHRFVNRMFDGKNSRAVRSLTNIPTGQHVSRLLIPEAFLEGKAQWYGKGFGSGAIEQQFNKYSYPAPGHNLYQMYYRYGGSFMGTMTQTNRYAKMYRTDKLPFVVNQSIWFEGEVKFADIILPACTNFERDDISEFAHCAGYIPDNFTQCNHRVIIMQKKCIEPLGESKPDYEIFRLLAERLGLEPAFSEGKSEMDWIKQMFYASDLPKYVTWERFYEKGYFVVPQGERKPTPAMRWFAEGRKKDTPDWGPHAHNGLGNTSELGTRSGLIEFESSTLKSFAETGEKDECRPVIPKYIPSWEGHHTKELLCKYPLALVSPHPRYSFHTVGDSKDSFTNDIKDHRVLIDGYYYWIVRINSEDAKERGIKDNDLVRMYNDRGEVILAAQVTERLAPGTVHSYASCAEYDPLGKPGESPDRAGCVNILISKRFITKTSCGIAPNSCLVQIERYR